MEENFKKGFTQIPNKVFNLLPLIDVTKRELKVVLLIIRLTYGCHRRWAILKAADLATVGISASHAGHVIDVLLKKAVLFQNEKTKQYHLNKEYLYSEVTKLVSFRLDKLGTLVGKQLAKRHYQTGNSEITNKVSKTLPNEGADTFQSGNSRLLPNTEVLESDNNHFLREKDKLNINKKNDKDNSFIADKNSFKKSQKINPYSFAPMKDTELAALEAWNILEPDNPNSFNFYIYAAHQGLPPHLFYEFTSEIKQDRTIKNKGAVFVKKVKDYFKARNLGGKA